MIINRDKTPEMQERTDKLQPRYAKNIRNPSGFPLYQPPNQEYQSYHNKLIQINESQQLNKGRFLPNPLVYSNCQSQPYELKQNRKRSLSMYDPLQLNLNQASLEFAQKDGHQLNQYWNLTLKPILTNLIKNFQLYKAQNFKLAILIVNIYMYKSFQSALDDEGICLDMPKIMKKLRELTEIQDISTQFNKFKRLIAQEQQGKAKTRFLKAFFEENLADIQSYFCPGCIRFFYNGMNMPDENSNYIPLQYFGSIDTLTQVISQLLPVVCSFLNSCGGVIYFGCRSFKGKYWCLGNILSQERKAFLIQQIITKFENNLYPETAQELKKLIRVQFVPISKLPLSKNQVTQEQLNQANLIGPFLQGMYMTRIRVHPSSDQVFFQRKQSQINCFIHDKRMPKLAKNRQFRRLQKRKIHDIPLQRFSFFDHVCQSPKKGRPIRNLQQFGLQNQQWYMYELVQLSQQQENQEFALIYQQLARIHPMRLPDDIGNQSTSDRQALD